MNTHMNLALVTPPTQTPEELFSNVQLLQNEVDSRTRLGSQIGAQRIRLQSITTEVVLKKRPVEDLESCQNDLALLEKSYAELPALRISLEQAQQALRRYHENQRVGNARDLAKRHAELFEYYKRDCQRLLDSLKELIKLEQDYQNLTNHPQIPTLNWSQMHQRTLDLPAVNGNNRGPTGRFI